MIGILVASIVAAVPIPTPWAVGDLTVTACSRTTDAQEATDAGLVGGALKLAATSDMPALLALQPALEALLLRHSDRGRVERCAEVVWVNSGDANDALYLQADMVGSVTKATASASRIEVVRNYVVDAAAILAVLAIERGERTLASRWLESGGRVAPNDPALLRLKSLLDSKVLPGAALQALRSTRAP